MNTIVNIIGPTLNCLKLNDENVIKKEKIKKYNKNHYLLNKEKILNQQKKYYLKVKEYKRNHYLLNKEKILNQQKKYYLKNKKRIKEYGIIYRNKNKEACKKNAKKWYLNNKEHKKQYDIIYKNKHKKRYQQQNKKYQKNNRKKINEFLLKKYHSDPQYKLSNILRKRILKVLKGYNKSKNTMNLLGCTIEQLWIHLEKSFKTGMTRENHGKWHIDHIKPCASFDLTKPEEQAKCFHYTNLQPLWASENLAKGSKIS